jgi:hypothetical protein
MLVPRWLACFGFLLVVGCSPKLDLPPSALVTCAAATDCPSDKLVCRNGFCVDPSNLDTTPPDLTSIDVTPRAGKKDTEFSLTLQPTKALAQPPEVTLALETPVTVPCTASGGTYVCTYTAQGSENGGIGGLVPVDVKLVDTSGNTATKHSAASFDLDFSAPSVVSFGIAYTPPPGSPIATPSAATVGTKITVSVLTHEPLAADAGLTMSAVQGASVIPFSLVEAVESTAVFSATLSSALPDGVYAPRITLQDLVGNRTTTASFDGGIVVKTSLPALAIDQAQVTYLRSPWGNGVAEDLGGVIVHAGPLFEIAPADPLAPVSALPASTFAFDGGGAPALVRIWADDAGLTLLGTLAPQASGSWPRTRLANLDLPGVFASGIDSAGNESAPLPIQNAEWVATLKPPAFGASPHRANAIPVVSGGLSDPSSTLASGLDTSDGTSARASSTPSFRELTGVEPPALTDAAFAFDAARGVLVSLHGFAQGLTSDVYEHDGSRWAHVQPANSGPAPSSRAGATYDAARNRVVMFGGGTGSGPCNAELWEWDGSRWSQRFFTGGPGPRCAPSMTFDSRRRQVVLFGGSGTQDGQLWIWDGSAWTSMGSSGPGFRSDAAIAYDPERDRLVLFGGTTSGNQSPNGDTWEWDGASWSQKFPAQSPPPLDGAQAMTFDPTTHHVVLADGTSLWEWDGANWSPRNTAGLQASPALLFDTIHQRLVAPYSDPSSGENLQELVTGTWRMLDHHQNPGPLADYPLAYDVDRHQAVLFAPPAGGSFARNVWQWDDLGWHDTSLVVGPLQPGGGAAAYDSNIGETVLFGGNPVTPSQGLYTWDGFSFTTESQTNPWPDGRFDLALAYDEPRNRVVVFGGQLADGGAAGDTWEWDRFAWSDVTPLSPAPSPSPRVGSRMVFDPDCSCSVLFGGYDPVKAQDSNETWTWNGGAWTNLGSGGPAPREFPAMAWDPTRNRMVLFGGDEPGSLAKDLWEWDGVSWTDRTPAVVPISARTQMEMTFDTFSSQFVLYGGKGASVANFSDTWGISLASTRMPAAQIDFVGGGEGISASQITGARVRAHFGATYSPYDAASIGGELDGWYAAGADGGVPGWRQLATNANGLTLSSAQPFQSAADGGDWVFWSSSSAAEAQSYWMDRDGQFSLQLRPSGTAGPGPTEAQVAVDYVELRVRYQP